MDALPLLDADDNETPFPDPEFALRDPDGLLAAGGNLSPTRLLSAYRAGIFPWYSDGQPILWWSPDPRTVLLPKRIKISRSLRKTLRSTRFRSTIDQNFSAVIRECGAPRRDASEPGTWLTTEMQTAYQRLHSLGYAHSIETWNDDKLVGGLYGVALGRVFFGESMFSRESDASKVALVRLCELLLDWQFELIDCQMQTDHLLRMGAQSIPRQLFTAALNEYCALPGKVGCWNFAGSGSGPASLPRSAPHDPSDS